jgi:hypothetical protein
VTFPDQEGAHIASMWTAHHDLKYVEAALEALEAADCVGVRTADGAAVLVGQAQVYATLALAEQQRISNLIEIDEHLETTSASDDWHQVRQLRPSVREGLGL